MEFRILKKKIQHFLVNEVGRVGRLLTMTNLEINKRKKVINRNGFPKDSI